MRPAADAPSLMHSFAAGLRFDTELQFLARMPSGRTAWRKLPTPEVSAQRSAWVALMQAEAIVTGRVSSTRNLRWAKESAAPALTPDVLLRRISKLAPHLNAGLHTTQTWLQVGELLRRPALASWMGPEGANWALVTGVELEIRGEVVFLKALLLLDPRMPAPWATGYNARLVPDKEQWQGLDGEVQVSDLLGLVALSPKNDR